MELFQRAARIANDSTRAACLCGIATSAVLVAFALQAWPRPPSELAGHLARGLLGALPIVASAFFLSYLHITHIAPPRRYELMRFSGCPRPVKVACHTLMLLGVGIFTCSVAIELIRQIGTSGDFAIRVGSLGLLAFSFMFAQLYSVQVLARRTLNRGRRERMDPLALSR